MDKIFHEKQEGSLCAQHCLNSLLQGQYLTAVDLATFAHDLDEAERLKMAEGDVENKEYLTFMEQPSENVDDSGFFSVQVLAYALKVFNLELLPFNSERCKSSRENPLLEKAYICHHNEHWLCLRMLGMQWFNLDSLLPEPELVSDTYLNLLLEQLKHEGAPGVRCGIVLMSDSEVPVTCPQATSWYSIFVVKGNLPPCVADEALAVSPVDPKAVAKKQQEHKEQSKETTSHGTGSSRPDHPLPPPDHHGDDDDDWALAMAITASLQQQAP